MYAFVMINIIKESIIKYQVKAMNNAINYITNAFETQTLLIELKEYKDVFLIKIRLIASSWVLEFKLSTRLEKCWVELKFFGKSVELSWEAWLDNSTRKLDLTRQDIR